MKRLIAFLLCLCLLSFPVMAEATEFFPEDGIYVTLDYGDGVSRPAVIHCPGQLDTPAEPTRRGFAFALWQTESGETVVFPFVPDASCTLYAVWEPMQMTVNLDVGGKDGLTDSVSVDYMGTLDAPPAPERKGYTFRYWSTEPEGEEATFPMTIVSDTTLYVVWMKEDAKVIVVSYDPGFEGAKEIKPVEVAPGKGIKKFPDVKREGYVLEGWSLTEGGKTIKAPYKPEESVTLYAVWSVQEYTVNFSTNYKDAPNDGKFDRVKAPGGTPLEAPERIPERENYIFTGWYTSAEGGSMISFPVEVTRSTTYYAHWQHESVATTVFDAEFTEFDPLEEFPGYSGEALGKQVIQADAVGSFQATTQFGDGMEGPAYYVSYMYKQGATITFIIHSDKDVTGASLYAALASESDTNKDLVIAPDGDFGYLFAVNGENLTYSPVNVGHTGEPFHEFLICESVKLKAGENVIQLITNNTTPMGGTMKASAPTVDYIRLDKLGDAQLTWAPVYDNIR